MKSKFIKNGLRSIPFFATLSEEELLEIDRILIRKTFKKNETILLEEDTSNYLYIIYSGKVKAVQLSSDGKEHILAIHGRGEFFGEMALLDRKTSPATIVAMVDSEIGLMGRKDFERSVLKNEKVLNELVSMLCERLRDAWLMLKVLHFANAEQRVRAVLTLISAQSGIMEQRGTIIPLKLTHQDIAAYASLTRETVTRIMGRFHKDDEIELLENKYILLKRSFLEKQTFL